jgi:TolB protein
LYHNLALSPDEQRVAVAMTKNGNRDVRILDLRRGGAAQRLTDDPGAEGDPIWSPTDGSELIFNSERTDGVWSLFRRPSNFSGQDKLLMKADDGNISAPDWSPDGAFVAYSVATVENGFDLWKLPLSGTQTPFLQTGFGSPSAPIFRVAVRSMSRHFPRRQS